MANYINKYASQNAYDNDYTKQYPNVSYISGGSVVFANSAPTVFGGLTVHYMVDSSIISGDVNLFNVGGDSSSESGGGDSSSESGGGGVMPTRMLVDGVEETPINTWRFETVGEHIVQFEFEDNVIPTSFINGNVPAAKNVEIGDDITEIAENGFTESHIEEATISDSVYQIGNYAFKDCLSLSSITINNTSVPSVGYTPFDNNASGRKIYVPSESVTDYQEAWVDYASDIEAIQ